MRRGAQRVSEACARACRRVRRLPERPGAELITSYARVLRLQDNRLAKDGTKHTLRNRTHIEDVGRNGRLFAVFSVVMQENF